jgi:hypothetical protein
LAVTVRGTPQTPTGNPTTSGNITVPATVVTGDPCLVWVTSRDSTGAGTLSVTDNDTGGNTWTKIANSTDHKATLWYKRATSGTAGKTVTVSNAVGSLSFVFKAFAGAIDTGNAYADITVETNISGNETHAGFTPSVADAWVWLSVHNYNNDNAVTAAATATNPGTLNTSTAEKLSTGGSDSGCHVAGKAQVGAAAATGNFTWAQTDGVTYSIVGIIKPLTVPNAPTVAAESSVTETSFSANWTAPGSGPTPTSYEIDVATDAGFTAIVSGYNGLDVGNVLTKSVTGLSEATNHWYRVRAVNSVGESANSGSEPVTTSTPSPPGAPTANAAYPVLGDSFVASWDAPGSGGTPTYYELDVATDSGFSSFVSGYNALNVGTLRRYSVTGLSASTPYWYRVRAGNAGGESTSSSAVTLTTTPAVTYVLRDEFITPDAAPVTSPRTTEPSGDTLTFVQTDGAFAISGNKLEVTAQTTPVWGDQGFYSSLITRAVGRAIRWEMTPGTNGQMFLGIDDNQAVGSYGQDLYNLFFSGNTSLKYNIENRDHYSRGLSPGVTYQLAMVLATDGVHFLVKGGAQYPEWIRIYRSVWNTTDNLYVDFGNYDHTGSLDNLRVVDLPAPWNTDTGGASTYLAGSQPLNQTFTHDADGNLDFKIVTLPSVANAEVVIRRQDANNYWFIRVTSAGDIGLYEVVGGAGAVQRGLAAGTLSNGVIISIRAEQATIAALLNGRETQWSYELADNFYTETDGEIITLDLGADIADITSWPMYISGTALSVLEVDGGVISATQTDQNVSVAGQVRKEQSQSVSVASQIRVELDKTFSTASQVRVEQSQQFSVAGQVVQVVDQSVQVASQVRVEIDKTFSLASQVRVQTDQTFQLAGQVVNRVDQTFAVASQVRVALDRTFLVSSQVRVAQSPTFSTASQVRAETDRSVLLAGQVVAQYDQSVAVAGQVLAVTDRSVQLGGQVRVETDQTFAVASQVLSAQDRSVLLASQVRSQLDKSVELSGHVRIEVSQTFEVASHIRVAQSQTFSVAGQVIDPSLNTVEETFTAAGQVRAALDRSVSSAGQVRVADIDKGVTLAAQIRENALEKLSEVAGQVRVTTDTSMLVAAQIVAVQAQSVSVAGQVRAEVSQSLAVAGQVVAAPITTVSQSVLISAQIVADISKVVSTAGQVRVEQDRTFAVAGQVKEPSAILLRIPPFRRTSRTSSGTRVSITGSVDRKMITSSVERDMITVPPRE